MRMPDGRYWNVGYWLLDAGYGLLYNYSILTIPYSPFPIDYSHHLRLKSPRFQALINSAQAAGLNIFIGGICPW